MNAQDLIALANELDAVTASHFARDVAIDLAIDALRACAADRPLAHFGALVFESFFGLGGDVGDLDGGDLQELAVKAGLLAPHTIETNAGCGECCNCVDNGSGAGDICYRLTIPRTAIDAVRKGETK